MYTTQRTRPSFAACRSARMHLSCGRLPRCTHQFLLFHPEAKNTARVHLATTLVTCVRGGVHATRRAAPPGKHEPVSRVGRGQWRVVTVKRPLRYRLTPRSTPLRDSTRLLLVLAFWIVQKIAGEKEPNDKWMVAAFSESHFLILSFRESGDLYATSSVRIS